MNAKCYALAIAALLHCALARVSFDEVMEMQSTEIGEGRAFINPRGPLCLLRGLVYSEQGYMHNKRFFAPEIETDYKVEPAGDVEKTMEHKYTRSAQNDKPYPPAEGPALSSKPARKNYAEEYHRILIEMFPSVDGHTLSVAVARDDSFFQFLQGMPTKQHAHYVLAALLLLSEGVNVPIEATQKKITLGTSILGNLPPEHRKTVGKESSTVGFKTKKDLCKKAAQVINFFKDSKGKGKLPCTQSDFNTGDFLNTPQFLIQAYVFEYITSKDDALDFAACAHAILTSLPENERKDVYSACFVESKAEEDELLHQLRMIQKAMKNLDSFPFTSPSMLPAYTSVHACKRGQTEFLDETFSNCVEAGLFALFCCLAHDPAQNKYDADAMLGEAKGHKEAKALRAFFQLKGVTPKACATKETMQEWNRVVSGLQSEHIAYKRESRNEVRSGIFNVLYVVAEVTGRQEEEEPRIRELALMLEGCKIGETYGDVFEKIQEYVAKLFESLSVDKSLRVEFFDLKVGTRSDGQKDLYGEITLKYTEKDSAIEQGICLAFQPGHLKVALCPCVFLSLTDEEKKALFAVNSHIQPKTFAECVFASYADAWRARARGTEYCESKHTEDTRGAIERLAVDGGSKQPNRLFILGPVLKYEQTCEIIEMFWRYTTEGMVELTREHPGVRLISNLLGSLPLDDFVTQGYLLQSAVCLNLLGELCPKVSLSKERRAKIYRNTFAALKIVGYIGKDYARAADVVMKHFRAYKDKARQPLFLCSTINSFGGVSYLFGPLLAGNTTRRIDEIGTLLLDVEEKDQEKALRVKALFDLSLFLCSLQDDSTPHELVLSLYRRVSPHTIQAYNAGKHTFFIDKKTAFGMLKAMEEHRNAILQMPGEEAVFQGVLHILKSFAWK
ncbi:uncharacterized protein NEMAJ01_2366 [Nematocida major]|uniref:uncharacterized protein n=1 Tax=Nematocida major TaxID=1912982 RepID=UPI0020085CB9|nr:uncharacterized protein NEMAJ01_2366 [Nematocida major]KAH9387470.1 hypothetical protein NEMAJ01_2366 [Nematocida major]